MAQDRGSCQRRIRKPRAPRVCWPRHPERDEGGRHSRAALPRGRMMSRGRIKQIVELVRRGDDVSPHIVIGPIVWEELSGAKRRWYFTIATADGEEARFDQIA